MCRLCVLCVFAFLFPCLSTDGADHADRQRDDEDDDDDGDIDYQYFWHATSVVHFHVKILITLGIIMLML